MARETLITGGAGFIGSHLAEYIRACVGELTLVDNLYLGRVGNATYLLDDRCRLVHASVSQALEAEPQLFDEVD